VIMFRQHRDKGVCLFEPDHMYPLGSTYRGEHERIARHFTKATDHMLRRVALVTVGA
jgi:hypothetical protein